MNGTKKFICDVMLGRLARWLRILGYDTFYENHYDAYQLLCKAISEKRILLTRNTKLYKMAGPNRAFFICSDHLKEQLSIVLKEFSLNRKPVLKICPACNGKIHITEKINIKDKVPKYTYKTHSSFYRCKECGKVYWQGSHSKLSREFLGELDED